MFSHLYISPVDTYSREYSSPHINMNDPKYDQGTEHIDDTTSPIASRHTQLEIDQTINGQTKRLLCKIDKRVPHLCAFLYFFSYLDRSNLGNGKVLNSETGDSLLQRTGMSENDYPITLSIFAIAYTAFDILSNAILKRYARPSYWLGALLFCWGALTLGFTGVQGLPAVITLRFFIGVFEAGAFPGTWLNCQMCKLLAYSPRNSVSHHVLVSPRIFYCDWPADLYEQPDLVQTTVDKFALLLLAGIKRRLLEVDDRPILFIASCLRGVILMKALVDAGIGDDYISVRRVTCGIIFLATPFRGLRSRM